MKITIYTINDCVFCNQEKEYLKSHNLPFEEKNLEVNREFLTEMLTLSNNFAGTPVTKIEKDDQSVIVLKGFTKEEFDDVLGFAAPVAQVAAPAVAAAPAVVAPVAMPTPVAPAPEVAPVAPAPVAAAPASHDAIASQIAELQRLQAQLAAQTAAPAPFVAPMPPVQVEAPVVVPAPVVPPPPEPMVQAPVSMPTPVVPPPVVAAPAAAAPTAAVDDSLASILAELQAKINAQQAPGSTPGQAN